MPATLTATSVDVAAAVDVAGGGSALARGASDSVGASDANVRVFTQLRAVADFARAIDGTPTALGPLPSTGGSAAGAITGPSVPPVRPTVTFDVYAKDDFDTLITTVTSARDADWLTVLGDTGAGRLLLQDGDGALAQVVSDRMVVVKADNKPIMWWVVEDGDDHVKAPGEEADQATQKSGRGGLMVLDRAPVLPTLPIGQEPTSPNRVLSFASPEFDISAWGTAKVIVEFWQDVYPENPYWTSKPSGFPNFTSAAWLGPNEGDNNGAPPGHIFLAKDFSVDDGMYVKFFVGVDNGAQVYVDGMLLMDIGTTDAFNKASIATIYLSAGWHRIAVHGINYPQTGLYPPMGPGIYEAGNPFGFILAGWEVNPGSGQLLSRVVTTDATWSLLGYPLVTPSFTIGQAFNVLLDGVQAHGLLGWIVRTWTDTHDSNGHTWDLLPNIGLKVGAYLLPTLKGWMAANYCDAAFAPDGPKLSLYRPGEMGTVAPIAYPTNSPLLVDLEVQKQSPGTDCLLVDWAGGQTLWPVAGGTRAMGYLEVGAAQTIQEAQTLAAAFLAQQSIERVQLTAQVRSVTGAIPGADYRVGDSMPVAGVLERATRIAGKIDDDQGLIATPTFRDLILSPEQRVDNLMKLFATGALAGQAIYATPKQHALPTLKQLGNGELLWNTLDPPIVESSPDRQISTGVNLYAVKAVCTVPSSSGDTEFELLVNGVDVLNGDGVLGATFREALIHVGPIGPGVAWIEGNSDFVALNITNVGTGVTGLVFSGWYII